MATTGRWNLFATSATQIRINPEYDFTHNEQKNESLHRSRAGNQYRYLWGSWDQFTFTLRYVDSSDAAIINSWWISNTELILQDRMNLTDIYSVHIVSPQRPLGRFERPYTELYTGRIVLETY